MVSVLGLGAGFRISSFKGLLGKLQQWPQMVVYWKVCMWSIGRKIQDLVFGRVWWRFYLNLKTV